MTVLHAPVAWNANQQDAHNIIINKMFAIHAFQITHVLPTPMDMSELHGVIRIINIVPLTYIVKTRKRLERHAMEIITNA